jgi:hypothetical protein
MKRFRVTILVVCLILVWLGYKDLVLLLRNPHPQEISLQKLKQAQSVPRRWLSIQGGYQNLLEAINMSGTVNIDAFLVPLKTSPDGPQTHVWFETRAPRIVEALKTYYFTLDTPEQRAQFVRDNRELFMGQRTLTGMTVDNLVASSNRTKLTELLQEMKVPVSEHTLFISEGQKPQRWRGFFFLGIGIIGFIKFTYDLLRSKKQSSRQPEAVQAGH